jgi:hypothetical protein
MVGQGNRFAHLEDDRLRASQDLSPNDGMALDLLHLVRGQLAGLHQQAIGDADLADIVQHAGVSDDLCILHCEVQPSCEHVAIAADSLEMMVDAWLMVFRQCSHAPYDVQDLSVHNFGSYLLIMRYSTYLNERLTHLLHLNIFVE